MIYDFETVPERRGKFAMKYEWMVQDAPEVPDDVVPFSVADMELKNPPQLVEGLKRYIDEATLGYCVTTANIGRPSATGCSGVMAGELKRSGSSTTTRL